MAYIKMFANYSLDLHGTGAFYCYIYSLFPKVASSLKVTRRKSVTKTK